MYFGFKKFEDINIFLSFMVPYLRKGSMSLGIPGTNLINLEGWKAESPLELHYSFKTGTPELWILTTRRIRVAKKRKKFNEIFQLVYVEAVTLTNNRETINFMFVAHKSE